MMMEIISNNIFIYTILGCNVLLLILYIINLISVKKIKKNYYNFMKKIGNGNNIDEMLKDYIKKVEDVNSKNQEIISFCSKLQDSVSLSFKKIGMVKYNAFKNVGNDLSFALALLNDNNDGFILNGIYSAEMSNIYAKQIKNGKCNSRLLEEEKKALEIAINCLNSENYLDN